MKIEVIEYQEERSDRLFVRYTSEQLPVIDSGDFRESSRDPSSSVGGGPAWFTNDLLDEDPLSRKKTHTRLPVNDIPDVVLIHLIELEVDSRLRLGPLRGLM